VFYDGQRVRLRPPERSDLKLFVTWLSNPAQRPFLSTRYVSEALEERWFESALDRMGGSTPSLLFFVIETLDGNVPIGFVSLMDINWRRREMEVGSAIGDTELWGQGYGTDALRTMLMVAFKWFQLHRVHLRVAADNTRAIRSYEKCNFQLEGRLREAVWVDGEYRDLLVMSILDREYEEGI